ncbi:sensor histidine kinase [Streptomyces sp. HUAS MG47]|uniref:sensor histidine kinase n=1 Tax=Streptomyces solicamelliae TaxID=3231716 RepID=UPI003877F29A
MRDWWKKRRRVRPPEELGPPNGFAMLPWLFMGLGAVSHLIRGENAYPVVTAFAILAFNSLYVALVFRAFDKRLRNSRTTWWLLGGITAVTLFLATAFGGPYLAFFPLLGLAVGSVARGRWLPRLVFPLCVTAGAVAWARDGWGAVNVAYGTFLSSMVTAAVLALSETVKELRATRQELARAAVEKERLRFSRDLHDLLGHTLSVIVVKSEAARRLAPRDLDAALAQIVDIESVGRQALTEIREAVTGYREGSLGTELDRARSALTGAGIEPVVRRSGPPLEPQTEALLSWVVREAATNVLRHSGATRCEIEVAGAPVAVPPAGGWGRVRLTVTDNGRGTGGTSDPGNGLTGLRERVAAAGGTLESGPAPKGGFRVVAELPVETPASRELEQAE